MESTHGNRWVQLLAGIVCMVMIANLQYGWNLFVNPIDQKFHWGRAAIQVAFSVFVLTETWLVPIEGWFVDRFGPRAVVSLGGALVALAWAIDSLADSLPALYIAAAISGIGAGAIYGTCVGNALKWFADRRGLAAGLTAAGFGAGAAATVVPIRAVIEAHGYAQAFLWFGLGQGAVVLVLAQVLRAPPHHHHASMMIRRAYHAARDHLWHETLRTPLFWAMYVTFVLVASGGLMATAQLASIAADFGVANAPIAFLGLAGATLSFALTVDNVLNGLARPFFGWVSDHIGREITMGIVFALGAASIWALGNFGRSPVAFVLLSGAVYFTWGEIFSLFPALCTDAFGARFATTNAGLLYTAKGTAALLVPLANLLAGAQGDWRTVFAIAAAMNLVASFLALVVLRPMLAAHRAAMRAETPAPSAA